MTDHLSGIKNHLDKNMKIVEELFESRKTLRKSDKELILSVLRSARQDIGSNAEFIANSFNEQMDKTVTKAKRKIEFFMQHQMNGNVRIGMEFLRWNYLVNIISF